jgi:hypothetical protein
MLMNTSVAYTKMVPNKQSHSCHSPAQEHWVQLLDYIEEARCGTLTAHAFEKGLDKNWGRDAQPGPYPCKSQYLLPYWRGGEGSTRASAFLTALHRLFLPSLLGNATPEFLHPVLNHKSESETAKERQRAGLAPRDPKPNIIDEVEETRVREHTENMHISPHKI